MLDVCAFRCAESNRRVFGEYFLKSKFILAVISKFCSVCVGAAAMVQFQSYFSEQSLARAIVHVID